jgi:hypothetical protein
MGPNVTEGLADRKIREEEIEDYQTCVYFLNMLRLDFHSVPVGDARLVVCDELGFIASFDKESGELKNYGLQ